MQINPYLNFPGTTEEAFNFYRSVFGGEFVMVQRFKEVPGTPMPEKYGEKIMHIALPLGNNVLMATDAIEEMGQKIIVGNNHHLSLSTDSKEEADRIFNALSKGGKIEMPLSNQFWGAYFGMCADKFGVQWMISFDAKRA